MTDTRISRSLKRVLGHANRVNGLSMAPMADLRGHSGKTCQFIAGEDHYMCGKPGFPYCATHRAICYRAEPAETQERSIQVDEMICAAAAAEGSTLEKIMSRDRRYTTTRARAAAVWLIFKIMDSSYREIAAIFGVSHGSIIQATEVHEKRMAIDEGLRARSMALLERFLRARAA